MRLKQVFCLRRNRTEKKFFNFQDFQLHYRCRNSRNQSRILPIRHHPLNRPSRFVKPFCVKVTIDSEVNVKNNALT